METMFSGYLPASGKNPIVSVKDESNWLEHPPATGDYVGILKPNIIQVDFDDAEDANIIKEILDEYKIKTNILKTQRGLHFYLIADDKIKSQSVGLYNAIGIPSDIGLGSKNRVVPLRLTREVDGNRQTIQRQWLQTYDTLDVIPPFLRPISKVDYGMRSTRTRNQTLFNYILALQTHEFSKQEVRKIIKIINRYVLYLPLTDSEIDTITRDEAFSEEMFFTKKGQFIHHTFGNYMLSNSNVMMLEDQMCIYTDDSIYSNDPNKIEKVMVEKIPQLKDSQRKEVYKYMELKCDKHGEYSHPRYLGLKDEILDIQTMNIIPYSPDFIINNKIQYNYKPTAYSKVLDDMLNKVACNDPEIRSLLEEMIGYTLYRENTLQMAFILTGEGSNGKSTLLDIIKNLLGKPNFTSLDLRELEDTFKAAELYNKLANIGDDISAKYLDTSSIFKKVVSGETFMVQKKYGQPFEMENYSTQIFCSNELPQVKDTTHGFIRRLSIVPFNAKFSSSDADWDPFIKDKLMTDESMEYLLSIAIKGLQRALHNQKFTVSSKGEKEKSDYVVDNNPILQFLNDEPKIANEEVTDVYAVYQQWCAANGVKPFKNTTFSKEVVKVGYESLPRYSPNKKKTVRFYIPEDEIV